MQVAVVDQRDQRGSRYLHERLISAQGSGQSPRMPLQYLSQKIII